MFHRAKSVTPLADYVLSVHFIDGSEKLYDMKQLFDEYPIFKTFEMIPGLFQSAKVDTGGCGIVWNEDVDIETEMIYEEGIPV